MYVKKLHFPWINIACTWWMAYKHRNGYHTSQPRFQTYNWEKQPKHWPKKESILVKYHLEWLKGEQDGEGFIHGSKRYQTHEDVCNVLTMHTIRTWYKLIQPIQEDHGDLHTSRNPNIDYRSMSARRSKIWVFSSFRKDTLDSKCLNRDFTELDTKGGNDERFTI